MESPTFPTLSTARIEITCSPSSKVRVTLDVDTSLQMPSRKIWTYDKPEPLPSSVASSKSEIVTELLSVHSSPSPIVGVDIVGDVLSIPMNIVSLTDNPEPSQTVSLGL